MRRPILIAAAVILALAGSVFAYASPSDKSPYRQLTQRLRAIATNTVDMPTATVAKLDWTAILKARNTVDICDGVTFDLASHTIPHISDCSAAGREAEDRHVAIIPAKADQRPGGGWWEAREPQAMKPGIYDRAKIWGRNALELTASRGGVHGV